jgi:hypothetical protein
MISIYLLTKFTPRVLWKYTKPSQKNSTGKLVLSHFVRKGNTYYVKPELFKILF